MEFSKSLPKFGEASKCFCSDKPIVITIHLSVLPNLFGFIRKPAYR